MDIYQLRNFSGKINSYKHMWAAFNVLACTCLCLTWELQHMHLLKKSQGAFKEITFLFYQTKDKNSNRQNVEHKTPS